MRAFIYISRTKLDNYFEQLSASRIDKRKLAAKIKVAVASLEFAKEWKALPDVQRLLLVESEIGETEDVGNIEQPGLWVQDKLAVRRVVLDNSSAEALFIGRKGETYTLLTGSGKHIIGASVPASTVTLPMSYGPYFQDALERVVNQWDENSAAWVQEYISLLPKNKPPSFTLNENELASIIITMDRSSGGLSTDVNFMGVRLWHFERDDLRTGTPGKFLVISPLFIEMSA